jgi:hypothetical protein
MDIGLLNEKPLHAALKAWYARPDDRLEVKVDGYHIDIVQGSPGDQDALLVEIQTRNFSAIKRKLIDLTKRHTLRLVYPIAQEKWIVKLPKGVGDPGKRRKSPKRGQTVDVFQELVSFPELLNTSNFSLEVLLIQEEEVRCYDGRKGWRRRGWVTVERRLLGVPETHLFRNVEDLWNLIPNGLPEQFTTADLASVMALSKRTAQQVAYCLRKMNAIQQIGKHGRSNLYVQNIDLG